MRRAALAAGMLAAALLAFAAPASARRWYGPRVYGGGVFVRPFWYSPYYYPYAAYPYPHPYTVPYPYPVYPPPPPPAPTAGGGASEAPAAEAPRPAPREARRATYGLVQLRGVPDGAAVDLDGRFWLTAEKLGERWLAVPEGSHTLVVRVADRKPVERRVAVDAGETHVVHFGEGRPRASRSTTPPSVTPDRLLSSSL